jgi:curved DNA-binding protein CbpA
MQQPPDHYAVLGVARDATHEDIKAAYRRKSREHHPDKGGDAAAMQAVNRAWEVLGDPERRARYDATGDERASDRDPMQAAAVSALADLMSGALEAHNPVAHCHGELSQRQRECEQQIMMARQKMRRLEKRRGLVRVKTDGAANIYQGLVDAQLAAARAVIEGNEKVLQLSKLVGQLLADYEFTGETIKPEPGVFDSRTLEALGYSMGAGRFFPGGRG